MSEPIRQRGIGDLPDEDVVSTPEGDNEYTPAEPVGPAEGLQVPNGNGPIPYDADKPERLPGDGEHHSDAAETVERTVDKLSLGQILT